MAAHSYLPNEETRELDVNPRVYLETGLASRDVKPLRRTGRFEKTKPKK